ncbi:hypothetical protein D1F64_10580 [Breoghania sp. L-A4]|nr:hypothetical protein D1F64_10580 [Breoghania sp. L-A4]
MRSRSSRGASTRAARRSAQASPAQAHASRTAPRPGRPRDRRHQAVAASASASGIVAQTKGSRGSAKYPQMPSAKASTAHGAP